MCVELNWKGEFQPGGSDHSSLEEMSVGCSQPDSQLDGTLPVDDTSLQLSGFNFSQNGFKQRTRFQAGCDQVIPIE